MGIDAEMFVKTKQEYTSEQVRHMAHNLAEAFGHGRFTIIRPERGYSWLPNGQHCLELVTEYEQDGPPISPENGEQFIRVHMGTRYYGEGYERGDLPFITGVARWLEARIPDAEVWYGGDSSGVCASHFDKAYREKLWDLFCKTGHEPYQHYFASGRATRPDCDFCLKPMVEFGWGPGEIVRFRCAGCGHVLITADGGETFQVPEPEAD